MSSPDYYIRQNIKPGSALYYALRELPANLYLPITLLLTLSRILQTVPLECSDNQVARYKLQWWRIECERLYTGMPTHPITQALAPLIKTYALPAAVFNQVIDTLERDLDQTSYVDQSAVNDYFAAISGIEALALKLAASPAELSEAYGKNLILSWRYSQLVQQFRNLVLHQQVKLTQAQSQQLTLKVLNQHQQTSALTEFLARMNQQAKEAYQQALGSLSKPLRASQLPFLLYSELQLQCLVEIAADHYQVFKHAIELTPLRQLWLAWRIKRRELKT